MRKLPYRSPDGLDWRDPNMPCMGVHPIHGPVEISPKLSQEISQQQILYAEEPNWRNDPTYNLRKKQAS